MDWIDLVAPSAAILSIFGVVALIVVAIRQGRQIRRLEDKLERTGDAAVEAPLQRIAELQARQKLSEGTPSGTGRDQLRTAGAIGAVVLVLLVAIGGVWYLFIRDDGSGTTADTGNTPTQTQTARTATTAPERPVDATLVPDEPEEVTDKTLYTVAVFNASGVQGAAGEGVAPLLQNEGWTTGTIANAPTTRDESVVMFTEGNRRIAWSVAQELGIKRAPPLDGFTDADIGEADVLVLVGTDLADNGSAASP
ncbi:MAG: LytR C-terminal domain-containing protein [Thermoleophilia bacterium]